MIICNLWACLSFCFDFNPNPCKTRVKSGYKLDKVVFVKYLYKIKIKFKYIRFSKS